MQGFYFALNIVLKIPMIYAAKIHDLTDKSIMPAETLFSGLSQINPYLLYPPYFSLFCQAHPLWEKN
jgi:hypothetical protein